MTMLWFKGFLNDFQGIFPLRIACGFAAQKKLFNAFFADFSAFQPS